MIKLVNHLVNYTLYQVRVAEASSQRAAEEPKDRGRWATVHVTTRKET